MAVEDLRRRRAEARAAGLCPACGVEKPLAGRTICERCNLRAKERVVRMRRKKAEQRDIFKRMHEHEAAGDAAIERYAYVEAGAEFERAIALLQTLPNDFKNDEGRLNEKIGLTLFYGARPDFATPWFERALQRCQSPTESASLLRRLITQAWLECKTPKALEIALQAVHIVAQHADASVLQRYRLEIAAYLFHLGRYKEAIKYSVDVTDTEGEDPISRAANISNLAALKSVQGLAAESFEAFERAAEIAKQIADGYLATSIWSAYANAAIELGRLDIARSCRAKALLVAQERRILWRLPFLTLRFATTLLIAGDYEHARDLLSDVLTYDAGTPTIRVLRAEVAAELAFALRDTSFLSRMFDEEALTLAFSSEEPSRFGPLTSIYAKIYIERGQISRARRLIEAAMKRINYADYVGDLLALAARYGTSHDAARARRLLIERTNLPDASVAKAFLSVWEMNAALRQHSPQKAEVKREDAANRFARLGFRHFRNQLYPNRKSTTTSQTPSNDISILSGLQYMLSAREQEVAVLVIRGLTNRAIAQALHITEHTVESHMTSILNRLGLRSRWQLHDFSSEHSTG